MKVRFKVTYWMPKKNKYREVFFTSMHNVFKFCEMLEEGFKREGWADKLDFRIESERK